MHGKTRERSEGIYEILFLRILRYSRFSINLNRTMSRTASAEDPHTFLRATLS